jgi:hypothetical protein
MRKLTNDGVVRALRNARRRKGGFKRLRFECVLRHAVELAWDDEFRRPVDEYVSAAEAAMRQSEQEIIAKVSGVTAEVLPFKRKGRD